MKKLLYIAAFLALTFSVSSGWCEIPKLINYQGMLTDDSGSPLTGTCEIIFKIYNASSGGDKRWEETQTNVTVTNGLFNVILGDVTPIDLDFSEDYWLEITVGGETMPSRLEFASVGYSYRAHWADTASYALSSPSGPGGSTWTFRITDVADTTLTTSGSWGVARYGNTLYGSGDSTHVNLGVACTTGTNGQDYKYCTVGGGRGNTARGSYATVGGGRENSADTSYAIVEGGNHNTASGPYTTVGGGAYNTASGYSATVGGGFENYAIADYATVGGGRENTVSTYDYATVGGGYRNTASGHGATVGGGSSNSADSTGATVGGGGSNTASGHGATVGGGSVNDAIDECATVGGGQYNTSSGRFATVGGGRFNTADTIFATVGGGVSNTASGYSATVAGGNNSTASGDYSFAAGRRAKANHSGAFVWADDTDANFASTGNNQFLIRASGGVGIGTTSPQYKLHIHENSSSYSYLSFTNSTTGSGSVDGVLVGIDPDEDFRIHTYEANNIKFYINNSEKVRITAAGNVGIGTTNPGTNLLAVNGDAAKPGGGEWLSFSDGRLKNIWGTYECGLSEVSQLKPVRYSYKEENKLGLPSGQEYVGLIAQEVKDIIPDAINENDRDYLMLDSGPIIWAMVNAIKELKAENELLRERVEALENK